MFSSWRCTARNVILSTLNSTAVHIQWDPPLTPNGIIIHYTVYINDIQLRNVHGTQSTSVGGFSPDQTVIVRVSASTTAGEGPLIAPLSVTTHETGIYIIFACIVH